MAEIGTYEDFQEQAKEARKELAMAQRHSLGFAAISGILVPISGAAFLEGGGPGYLMAGIGSAASIGMATLSYISTKNVTEASESVVYYELLASDLDN